MNDLEKRFSKLPDDGVQRYIIIASIADPNSEKYGPSSYGMFYGHYFNGDFQWAANEIHAFRIFEERKKSCPEYHWEIYELLPDRSERLNENAAT